MMVCRKMFTLNVFFILDQEARRHLLETPRYRAVSVLLVRPRDGTAGDTADGTAFYILVYGAAKGLGVDCRM